MPTLCVVLSFLIVIPVVGTLEWYCIQAEKHKEEDKPEYLGEFGKEAPQQDSEFLSFKRAIQAHNNTN